MNDAVIDGNGADHRGTLAGQLLAEGLCIAVAGQVHDRLSSHIDGAHDLFHLDVIILAVSGNAQVDIDLGAEHAADAFRIQRFVQTVGRDRDLAFCNELHQILCRHVLFFRDLADLFRDDAFSCRIHLRRIGTFVLRCSACSSCCHFHSFTHVFLLFNKTVTMIL